MVFNKGVHSVNILNLCNYIRPYELIAVATEKGIAIWHLGLNLDLDGRLPTERVALLSAHEGEVCTSNLSFHSIFSPVAVKDSVQCIFQIVLSHAGCFQCDFLFPVGRN